MRKWLAFAAAMLPLLFCTAPAFADQTGYCPKPTEQWCLANGYSKYGQCTSAWDQGKFCLGAARTQTFVETIKRDVDGVRLQVTTPQNEMQPTGYHVAPGALLRVKVTLKKGADLPILVVGTPHRDTVRPSRTFYPLVEGENLINAQTDGVDVAGSPFNDTWGGTAYIQYTSATPDSVADIEFSEGFKRVPYFVTRKTTHAQYLQMFDVFDDVEDVMMVCDRAMFTMRRVEDVLARNLQQYDQQLMCDALDLVVEESEAISGIDGSAPEHMPRGNRLLISVRTSGGNPSSWTGAITLPPSYLVRVADPAMLTGANGWGPWHEVGHTHQQTAWKWSAVTESTVNIYSLAVERAFGVSPPRLVRDNQWPGIWAFLALPDGQRNYNASTTSNYVPLGMFQQLWLAFGDRFYRDLHKLTRVERPVAGGDAERMRYFMLKSCQVSGKDLSGFFRKWGLPVSQSVYDEIAALGLPAPTVDPATLHD